MASVVCVRVDTAIWRRHPNAAKEVAEKLQLAKQDGAPKGSILRKLKPYNKFRKFKILREFVEDENLELALMVYKSLDREDKMLRLYGQLAALLNREKGREEADKFVLKCSEDLPRPEKVLFGSALIEYYAKYGLWGDAYDEFEAMRAVGGSAQVSAYRSMVQAQAVFGDPFDAAEILQKMKVDRVKPCAITYKRLLHAFGRVAAFDKMPEILQEMKRSGYHVDATACNMMLGVYGMHKRYDEMQQVLDRMQNSRMELSVFSWNAVSSACPVLMTLPWTLESSDTFPGFETLYRLLEGREELKLVETLMANVVPSTMVWSPDCWKLDTHGMNVGTAFLSLLCWLEEAKRRIYAGSEVPSLVEIVTGKGLHSKVEGLPPVKITLKECFRKTNGPFRVDRRNKGRMIARGYRFKLWLLAGAQSWSGLQYEADETLDAYEAQPSLGLQDETEQTLGAFGAQSCSSQQNEAEETLEPSSGLQDETEQTLGASRTQSCSSQQNEAANLEACAA